MREWMVAGLLALGLASGSAGTAQAGSYLGGTLDVRIGGTYHDPITGQGGGFAALGLAQAVAGDPGRSLLTIIQDESTGRVGGFAAVGAGIVLNNTVDGSSVFQDFAQHVPVYPAERFPAYSVEAANPICSFLLNNVTLLGPDGSVGLGGRGVSRTDSDNAACCFLGRRVAFGGPAVRDRTGPG